MTTYNSLTVEDLVVKRLWVEHKRIDTINLGSLVVSDPLYNVGIGTDNPEVRLDIIGTSAIRLPVGNNEIERPDMSTITNKDGIFRYNSSDKTYETYFLNKWRSLGGSQLELSTESGVSKSTIVLNKQGLTNSSEAGTSIEFRLEDSSNPDTLYQKQAKILVKNGGASNTGNIHFQTANGSDTYNDRIVIKKNGDVGVGTNHPIGKLHLEVSAQYEEGFYISNAHATYGSDSDGGVYHFNHYNSVNTSARGLILQERNTTNVLKRNIMTWQRGTGNVGIDMLTPNSKLHIFESNANNKTLLILQKGAATYGNSASGPAIEFKTFLTSSQASKNQSRIRGIDDVVGNGDYGGLAFDYRKGFSSYTEGFRLSSSGYIGVNRSDPKVILDISGTGAIQLPIGTSVHRESLNDIVRKGMVRYNTTTDQFEGYGAGNAWGSLGGVKDIDQDTFITVSDGTTDTDEIKFFAGNTSTEKMIIKPSGSVGIGTSSPQSKLHVNSDTGNCELQITAPDAYYAKLSVMGDNSGGYQGTGEIYVGQSTSFGGGIIYNGDGNPTNTGSTVDCISFYRRSSNVNTEVFRYSYGNSNVIFNGNVGIGTSSRVHLSTETLDIMGSFRVGGNDGNLTIESRDETVALQTRIDGRHLGQGLATGGGSENRYVLSLQPDFGYVGIGKTNPGAKLDVNGSMRASYDTNTASYFGRAAIGYCYHDDCAGFAHLHCNNSTKYALMQHPAGWTYLNCASSTGICFRINNSDKMRMDSSGRLGIGTTSPTDLLTVGQMASDTGGTTSMSILAAGENADAILYFGTGRSMNVAKKAAIIAEGTSTYSRSKLHFCLDNTANNSTTYNASISNSRMTIDSNGEVGIGKTNPGALLDVNGSMRASYDSNTASYFGRAAIGYCGHNDYAGFAHLHCNNSTQYALMQNMDGWTYLNCASSRGICFRIAGVDKMRMDSSGRLGIGKTNPGALLDVNGSMRAAYGSDTASYFGRAAIGYCGHSDYAAFAHYSVNSTVGYALIQNSSGTTLLNAASGRNIHFRINNSDKMIMNSSGQLKIGTGGSYIDKLNIDGGLVINGSGYSGRMRMGRAGHYHQLSGRYPSTQTSLIIESNAGAEGSMIYINGNESGVVNPGDNWTWAWHDEDANVTQHTTNWKMNSSGGISSTSDIRVKEDIRYYNNEFDMETATEKYSQIKFCKWKRKKPLKDPSGVKLDNHSIIAQELELLFPDMITHDNKGIKQLNFQYLDVMSKHIIQGLIQSMKTQMSEINILKEQLSIILSQNKMLLSRLEKIENS